jgi:hypothetical protein
MSRPQSNRFTYNNNIASMTYGWGKEDIDALPNDISTLIAVENTGYYQDDILTSLSKLTSLTILELRVFKSAIFDLSSLTRLTHLKILDYDLRGKSLALSPGLIYLSLHSCYLDNNILTIIGQLQKLKVLDLGGGEFYPLQKEKEHLFTVTSSEEKQTKDINQEEHLSTVTTSEGKQHNPSTPVEHLSTVTNVEEKQNYPSSQEEHFSITVTSPDNTKHNITQETKHSIEISYPPSPLAIETYHLFNLTSLTQLELTGYDNTYNNALIKSVLANISVFSNLTSLNLDRSWCVTSDDLEKVGTLINLTELNMSHTRHQNNVPKIESNPHFRNNGDLHCSSGGNLSFLSSLTNLTTLYAAVAHVSNDDLKDIATLSNLKVLNLDTNHITTLTPLTKLSKLEFLAIAGNEGLLDKTMTDLISFMRLQTLKVGFINRFTGEVIPHIARVTSLTSLELYCDPSRHSHHISLFEELVNLTDLNLVSVQLNDDDLAYISTLNKLVNLRIGGDQHNVGIYSDIGVVYLANLTNLKRLKITLNTDVTVNGLIRLKNMGKLTHLEVRSGDKLLNNEHLTVFLKFVALKFLYMEYCENADDTTIQLIESRQDIKISYMLSQPPRWV